MKTRLDEDEHRLAGFKAAHGIVGTPETSPGGQTAMATHDAAMLALDELERQLVAATSERILCAAEFRAASEGDPEMVLTADPRLASNSSFAAAAFEQLQARRSALEQERAQLSAEHGQNFPRVVEIGKQLEDLERQNLHPSDHHS